MFVSDYPRWIKKHCLSFGMRILNRFSRSWFVCEDLIRVCFCIQRGGHRSNSWCVHAKTSVYFVFHFFFRIKSVALYHCLEALPCMQWSFLFGNEHAAENLNRALKKGRNGVLLGMGHSWKNTLDYTCFAPIIIPRVTKQSGHSLLN